LPPGASFTDNLNGSGTFDWTPNFIQNGVYNVTFVATDGSVSDTEVVAITVNEAGNQTPILAAIGAQVVLEGNALNFGVTATDPDSTTPTLAAAPLPSGASYTDNGDGTGSFDWIPNFAQSGTYNVTFSATDGAAADSEVVSIQVNEAGNQPPILAAIGPQNTLEGQPLGFVVSATDADGIIPSLTTSALPSGGSFVDHGDGTGSFAWTPGFTQSGTYNVTFRASDGGAIDSEVVLITVNEAGNQIPVLAPIGPQSTSEGALLAFSVSATDADNVIPSLNTASLPVGASFVDNGNGTGDFSWTPDFTQSGSYPVIFRASDGAAVDTEVVTITVNEAGNQPPVLATIGAQGVLEGLTLSFGISASDIDGTVPTFSTSTLPSGASFTDNGDGTGAFDWTPDFTQSGTYPVTFRASDGSATDSEIVNISVSEAGNQTPVLAAIGAQVTTEGLNISFGVSAGDPDGTTPTLTAGGLPAGATFTDNGNGTGTFDWMPDFTQAGNYNVTFRAGDGVLTDSEVITLTVLEAGNQRPTLASIGAQSTTEGVNLSLGVSASDPDATLPILTAAPLPAGASFADNGDGTGTFDWTPDFTQSGNTNLTFIASDGVLADSEVVSITVFESGNQTPVLATIGPRNTNEGVLLNFVISATDPDGTTPALSGNSLPAGASFTDNGDGTGTFDWTPDFTQDGAYNVTFVASDGLVADTEVVSVTVFESGNQTPTLAAVGPRGTTEGTQLLFNVSATDPDGTIPGLSTSSLPAGASFTDNGDGSGTFDWTPNFNQSGGYSVTFRASDGLAVDSEIVSISINEAGNQSPVLAAIGPQSTTEGVTLNFGVSATDPDLSTPTLSTSALPPGASFTDNGNGTGNLNWTPDFTQAGNYDITFRASDGVLIDSEIVTVSIVESGNQTPVLAAIGPQTTTEGVTLNFAVSATDPDGTNPSLTTTALPTGASFTDNGDGTGDFVWTPDFTQSGGYAVTFVASDGVADDSESVTITVIEAGNQAPVLAAIGSKSTPEGSNLNFSVSATDPDSTTPALTAAPLPGGATFTDNGDGTGTFDWSPDFAQSGVYNITFRASDGGASDSEVVTIVINESGNQTPVLAAIGPQATNENVQLTFGVSATDPDGTTPALTTVGLPTGASFTDNGNGTGSFDWTPDFTQSGSYQVTFIASDGIASDSEVVPVTVNELGNQAPVLAAIGAQSTTEGVNVNFGVTASDPDATTPNLSTVGLPAGASFTDNLDGTGTFDWAPGFTQSGVFNVTFIASDGSLADSEVVAITVNEAGNQLPELTAIGARSITEGANLNFLISALDVDGPDPTLSTNALPSGATFTDNGDGSGTFDWTPDFTQAGAFNVTFRATTVWCHIHGQRKRYRSLRLVAGLHAERQLSGHFPGHRRSGHGQRSGLHYGQRSRQPGAHPGRHWCEEYDGRYPT
jgi:hypothetical protein